MTNPNATTLAINAARLRLEGLFLQAVYDDGDFSFGATETFFSFARLSEITSLPQDIVRAICRSLTDMGLMKYQRGLFSESGQTFGAGYALTQRAVTALEADNGR